MRTLIAIMLVCLSVNISFADPDVTNTSGTLSHGETVTITGSDFGSYDSTKSGAAPLIWDTFEDEEEGVQCDATATTGTWNNGTSAYYLGDTGTVRGQSSVSYECDVESSDCSWYKTGDYGDGQKFYMSLWRRYSYTTMGNQKFFRIYPTPLGQPDLVLSYGANWPLVEGCWNGSDTWDATTPANQWVFEELIVESSSGIDQADGVVTYIRDGNVESTHSNMVSRCTAQSGEWVNAWVSNYGEADGDVWMDDIYIDYGWQRVYVASHDTLAASTHREIQPFSAWATGSITVTFNQGTFANSATAYIYVVDNNDVENASGYEITIGGVGGSTPTFSGIGGSSGLNIE